MSQDIRLLLVGDDARQRGTRARAIADRDHGCVPHETHGSAVDAGPAIQTPRSGPTRPHARAQQTTECEPKPCLHSHQHIMHKPKHHLSDATSNQPLNSTREKRRERGSQGTTGATPLPSPSPRLQHIDLLSQQNAPRAAKGRPSRAINSAPKQPLGREAARARDRRERARRCNGDGTRGVPSPRGWNGRRRTITADVDACPQCRARRSRRSMAHPPAARPPAVPPSRAAPRPLGGRLPLVSAAPCAVAPAA